MKAKSLFGNAKVVPEEYGPKMQVLDFFEVVIEFPNYPKPMTVRQIGTQWFWRLQGNDGWICASNELCEKIRDHLGGSHA